MLYWADIVIAGHGEPIAGGAVRVDGNRIVAVGPADRLPALPGEPIVDLPGRVLSPGFINAHCHLDYSRMKGLLPGRGFVKWIQSINALKRNFSDDDYLEAIDHGFKLLMVGGTTTVANIESFPELLPRLKAPPIRTWWFLELGDLRSRFHSEESLVGALGFFQDIEWPGGFGLSPHSPYTASLDLYRLAKRCSDQFGMPFTTHIAESREEQEMFLYGSGPLYELMEKLGRDVSDCGEGSSLSHLMENEVLTAQCLAVHLNYLQEYDWPLLTRSGATVVHCPKSHAYFQYAPFQLERMRSLGINLCIGTDSLASNTSLDLRSELRVAKLAHPSVSDIDWWRMITANPARVLGKAGELGTIAPGALADLVAFPLLKHNDPFRSLIEGTGAPDLLVVDGKRIISP